MSNPEYVTGQGKACGRCGKPADVDWSNKGLLCYSCEADWEMKLDREPVGEYMVRMAAKRQEGGE